MKEGIVTKTPSICGNNAVYEVSIDGKEFSAESVGAQAVKDYLFVRTGQSIEFEGNITSSHIEVQNAKIDIVSIVDTQ